MWTLFIQLFYCFVGVGGDIMKRTYVDIDGEKQKAVEEALEKAEQRHTRELKGALRRQEILLTEDKEKALAKQKQVTSLQDILYNLDVI